MDLARRRRLHRRVGPHDRRRPRRSAPPGRARHRHLPRTTPARRCSSRRRRATALLGLVSSTHRLPRRDAADAVRRASPTARCATFLAEPDVGRAAGAVARRRRSTASPGWAARPLRPGPLDESSRRIRFSYCLVPRQRQVLARPDEGAPAADDRRPRHAGDVRRDRRERRPAPTSASPASRRSGRHGPSPTPPRRSSARVQRALLAPTRARVRVRATDRSGVRRVELGVRSTPRCPPADDVAPRPSRSALTLPRREHELLVIATDTRRQRVEAVPADAVRRPARWPARVHRAHHQRRPGGGGRLPLHRRADRPRHRPRRRPVLHRHADRRRRCS